VVAKPRQHVQFTERPSVSFVTGPAAYAAYLRDQETLKELRRAAFSWPPGHHNVNQHAAQWKKRTSMPRQIDLDRRMKNVDKAAQTAKDAKDVCADYDTDALKKMRKACMQTELCIDFNLDKCDEVVVGGAHQRAARNGKMSTVEHSCAHCGPGKHHCWLDCQQK
jgi:hypothetical protein